MAEIKDTTILVRIAPTIALDYAARGVFPEVRLQERPGRVPTACDLLLPRATAQAMLADARTRPGALKKERPDSFKGGAVTAWAKLVRDLEFELLPKRERDKIHQARALVDGVFCRACEWRDLVLDAPAPTAMVGLMHDFWFKLNLSEKVSTIDRVRYDAFHCEHAGKRDIAMQMLRGMEGLLEADLESKLGDVKAWAEAGSLMSRIAGVDVLAVDKDQTIERAARS